MGQVSNKSESILSNEFLSDEEIINYFKEKKLEYNDKQLEEFKLHLLTFSKLIIDTYYEKEKFRNK